MKLSKDEIRQVLNEEDIFHTEDCRTHNPRGLPGGHPTNCKVPPRETLTIFGGYHCICDWMERIKSAYEKIKVTT